MITDSNEKQALSALVAEYWQLHGMHCDPFEDDSANDWFFTGADREQLLQTALRTTRFATHVLVFAGTRGVGKSKLLEALMAKLEGVSSVLHLQGSFTLTVEQVFGQIGDKLGLQAGKLPADELRSLALQQLQRGLPHSKSFIVLVDDAHELPERTLASLLALAQDDGNSIKLLLFAATDANGDLTAELVSDALQRTDIAPLDLTGVEEYLRYRLTMAGYDGLSPFTQADVLSIFQHSGGIPEHMHAMAEQKMRAGANQSQSSPPTPPTSPTSPTPPTPPAAPRVKIPWRHVAASFVLIFFIAVLWSAGGDDAAPAQSRILIPPGSKVSTLPTPNRTLPAAAEAAAPDRTPRAPAEQSSWQTQKPESQATERLEERSATSGNSAAAASESASLPENLPRSSAAAGASPTAPAENKPAVEAPVARPAASPSAPVDTSTYTSDERYLLDLPASHYTLQLLGSKSEQGVEDFAKRNAGSNIVVFRQLLNSKPWYVAVTGDYPNQEQATTALARLPKILRELQPWARPLSKVQGDINAAAAAR